MEPFNLKQVRLTGGFFKEAEDRNARATIPAVYHRFQETGRFDALKCKKSEKRAHIFWDSDVAKWLEAAAIRLYKSPDPTLRQEFDRAVNDIVHNALPCGYFNSYFQVYEPEAVFTRRSDHELYCAGHLFEAAVAAKEYLNDDRLLQFSSRYVDYITERFVTRRDTGFTTPGHEEIELALLHLYRLTGGKKYLDLAAFFLNERGKEQGNANDFAYDQSHRPVRMQTAAIGHAVRAGYLYTAMAEYARITGDEEMASAAKALFENIVNRKMSVSGSMGNLHHGEQFSCDYDLANYSSYNETCAAIALVLFADRMLRLTGDASCGDVIERAVYNGALAGLSLSGEEFFYVNPLEMQLSRQKYTQKLPGAYSDAFPLSRRVKIFDCSCCPPNLCRFFEEFPQYLYYEDPKENTLVVSQYASSVLNCSFGTVRLSTDLPYSGKVEIAVEPARPFTLKLRVPSWCDAYEEETEQGYLVKKIEGKQTIPLDFAPRVRKVYAHPAVWEDRGKVALFYGPLLLALEGAGNDFPVFSASIGDLAGAEMVPAEKFAIPTTVTGTPTAAPDIKKSAAQSDMPIIPEAATESTAKEPAQNTGFSADVPSKNEHFPFGFPVFYFRIPVWVREENRPLYAFTAGEKEQKTALFVPYFAWANREESDMAVFFPDEGRS